MLRSILIGGWSMATVSWLRCVCVLLVQTKVSATFSAGFVSLVVMGQMSTRSEKTFSWHTLIRSTSLHNGSTTEIAVHREYLMSSQALCFSAC